MIIGTNFLVKINANIGNSAVASSIEEETAKMQWAAQWGADTIMDLSTGANIHETREWIVRNAPVPIGSVPIYQALEKVGGVPEELTFDLFMDTLVEQAEQGVDYFTIHAGVLLRYIPMTADRVTGIVSRGGSIMAKWCLAHHQENFLYTRFREICELMSRYDISFSLGDGLRPGSVADANDEAQFAELETQGELTRIAWEYDVQVMNEGPWTYPDAHDQRERRQADAPVRRSAVLHTRAAHHRRRARLRPHHLRHRRGDDRLVRHRDALLRHSERASRAAEPRRCQRRRDRLQNRGACGRSGERAIQARANGKTPSPKRVSNSDGKTSSTSSLDPDTAREYHDETLPADAAKVAHFCSMCGPKFCSMRITQDIRDYAAQKGVTSQEAIQIGMEEKSREYRKKTEQPA